MASQADLEPAEETKRVVKVSMFFNKRVDVSDEEFHRYWSDDHGPLLCSIRYFKEKIIKYNQVSLVPRQCRVEKQSLELRLTSAAEVWASDLETALGVMKDPEHLEKIAPDEEKFTSKEGSKFFVGYDDLMMDTTQ